MCWTNTLIVLLLLQALLITDIDANANRRRYHRRRRQTSGSLYGTNANLGASAPAGYNYPEYTNIKGERLNNADARDLYGNPLLSPLNRDSSLSSVNYYNQPRPPIQQVYGNSDQSLGSSSYIGGSFYSGNNANKLVLNPSGDLASSAPIFSQYYASPNDQMAYPALPNQVLATKDLYGSPSNANSNNNQYGYSSNLLPNSNTYGGQMGSNSNLQPNSNSYGGQMGSNNNLLPNSNNYGGSSGGNTNLAPNSNAYGSYMGSNANLAPNRNPYGGLKDGSSNLIPDSNSYSGYMGTDSNPNSWSNTNNNNRYGQNGANNYYPNRDTNQNNYNRYSNSNMNPPYYNYSNCLSTSAWLLFLSILAAIFSQS